MTPLRTFYPPIEPCASGMIEVGDGHSVYYERCSTPGGTAARVPACSPTIAGCWLALAYAQSHEVRRLTAGLPSIGHGPPGLSALLIIANPFPNWRHL